MSDEEIPIIDLNTVDKKAPTQQSLSEQIKKALLADAHAQRSHRELDKYLSDQKMFPVITQMIESLQDLPDNPFNVMAQRLRNFKATENDSNNVLGKTPEQILQKDSFFSCLNQEIQKQVLSSLEIVTYEPNQVIANKNSSADKAYIITKGSFFVNNIQVTAGHVACQYSLLQQETVHPYEIIAGPLGAETQYLTKENSIKFIYENQLQTLSQGAGYFHQYVKKYFISLTDEEIDLLSQLAQYCSFSPGEYIAKQTQLLNSIYVVLEVFDREKVDEFVSLTTSNKIQELEKHKRDIKENHVLEGMIIGAQGVLIGKEERRDFWCQGVVECLRIDADELKKRNELYVKLGKSLAVE
ncbi:Transcription factor, CAP family protein [Spironucleus salmonicida]|uniref:Transcription factor, CAP family protein n=1 Tax=Spironucleus salmonicida TaxID=348837 RepID=V6LNE8_9EUKA|nr:Transcription factor, CAP family protein [Spironucleus salmonicida]|eukprot:EST42254.1 hypothetical protein SS50377_18553 [Spironucleus salmonicida]